VTPVVASPRRAGRWTDAKRVTLNSAYVRALDRAGLVPLALPTMLAPERAVAALCGSGVRGLVLTGGEDVEPALYGATPHPRLEDTDPTRDAAELALHRGRARAPPAILAICRGIQILNVALGGLCIRTWGASGPAR